MKINYDGHEHEHELEPAYGLPERLPANERILWQGSPDWRTLARRVFFVRTLALYFLAILIIRGALVLVDGGTAMAALKAVLMVAPLAVLAVGTMLGLAVMAARTSVYTITDKRIVMRIGIVLGVTFNLPFGRIATAGLQTAPNGTGDIPLTLAGDDQIGFMHLWPHARPWRITRPEPMLRCVPQAQVVGELLARAWSASTGAAALAVPVADKAGIPGSTSARTAPTASAWSEGFGNHNTASGATQGA
jgi:hypothetical protein